MTECPPIPNNESCMNHVLPSFFQHTYSWSEYGVFLLITGILLISLATNLLGTEKPPEQPQGPRTTSEAQTTH